MKPTIYETRHTHSEAICSLMEMGTGFEVKSVDSIRGGRPHPAIVYGNLRGCSETMKQAREQGYDYWYIDHGYFSRTPKEDYENYNYSGYFRITRNSLQAYPWHLGACPEDRWRDLSLPTERWDIRGETIFLLPPSVPMAAHYGISRDFWEAHTKAACRRFAHDLPVEVLTKDMPLRDHWDRAYAIVAFNSNAGLEAIMKGIPAFATCQQTSYWGFCGHIEDLRKPRMPERTPFFSNLAYGQFTVEEMRSGEAWDMVQRYQ